MALVSDVLSFTLGFKGKIRSDLDSLEMERIKVLGKITVIYVTSAVSPLPLALTFC